MSARNRHEAKRIRRLERSLRKGRVPARIDLVQWLIDHGHAKTTGAARKLIHERKVVSESHPLGWRIIEGDPHGETEDDQKKKEVYDPIVPASLRGTIVVTQG